MKCEEEKGKFHFKKFKMGYFLMRVSSMLHKIRIINSIGVDDVSRNSEKFFSLGSSECVGLVNGTAAASLPPFCAIAILPSLSFAECSRQVEAGSNGLAFVSLSSDICLQLTPSAMADREDNVYKAKLAEQAERYDGKCIEWQ